ncbi:MAG: hypothetical protein PWQ20_1494 [Thermotogaceae bacterium]|nr:hypothetical protein [Thermotogaceae bacterium]
MKKIIEKYKNRLVDISTKNKTLYLNKMYKKRSFDLFELKFIDEDILDSLIEKIIGRKKDKIAIVQNQRKFFEYRLKEINKLLKENKLNEEEAEKLEKELEECFLKILNNIKSIKREIDFIEKETGRYELFVGYPFVEGKFRDGTYIKAPLFLFPVKIISSGDNWYLQNIIDEEIMLNKVFLIAYQKYNELNFNQLDPDKQIQTEEKINLDEYIKRKGIKYKDFFEDKNFIIEYLNEIGIYVNVTNTDNLYEKFIEGKDEKIPLGNLYLRNYIVLGNFHLASSIYNDYLKLEEENKKHKLLELLLLGKQSEEKVYDNKPVEKVLDKEFFYISPLDYTQEKAIKKVQQKDALVIYGPPGTGKSQTISNLIADNLAKDKKVLVVSEKRAALDVIYNRLSKIQSKVVLVHDAQKGKTKFYEKVKEVLDYIENCDENFDDKLSVIDKDLKSYSEDIDEKLEKLERFGDCLFKEREFGLSLQQMYAKTKKKLTEKEEKVFVKLREELSDYRNITYDKIEKVISKLEKEIVEKYMVFNNYRKEFKEIIESLKKSEMDPFEIQTYINNLDKIIESSELKLSLTSRYSEEIKNHFLEKKFQTIDFEEFIDIINKKEKHNEIKRVESLEKKQWWNPFYYIFKTKRIKEIGILKEEIKKNRKRIEKDIEKDWKILQDSIRDIEFLKELTNAYDQIFEDLVSERDISMMVRKFKEFLSNYDEYKDLEMIFKDFSKIELDFLEFSSKLSEVDDPFNIIQMLPKLFILDNIFRIEKKERDFLSVYKVYEKHVEQIKNHMENKMMNVSEYILYKWNKKFKTIINNASSYKGFAYPFSPNHFVHIVQRDYKEFKRQAKKKRRLWSLRKYIEEFKILVFNLFPCFLLTPEVASEILPFEEGIFDMVIFDEASQIFIEKSIPTIYRARKVVVSGDDKQLKPTSFFISRLVEDDEDEEYKEYKEIAAAIEEESLLDLAKINFDYTRLLFHYRSKYKELISFSNYAFYNGELYVSPNVELKEIPIERIKVSGEWKNRQNLEEARKVVELVYKILKERRENETIGIITFNVTQRDLIEDLLDNFAQNNSQFQELYNNELMRTENGEDKSIFVKNIENVQGDERDIIIFSIGYAPDESGRLRLNFGALNKDGGENRLNVAISRAKKKIYVVTSIEPEELRTENLKNPGPRLLKEYLKYVKAVSDSRKKEAEKILYSLSNISGHNDLVFESNFEEEVYEKLSQSKIIKQNRLELHTQVSSSGYRIDIGVYDPRQSKYILGVECDGALYHSSKSARERDIHRQKFLESRGWKILRIWSKNWWENPEEEIKRIEKVLDEVSYTEEYDDKKVYNESISNE